MLEDCAALTAGMRLSKAALLLEDGPQWKGFAALERFPGMAESWQRQKRMIGRQVNFSVGLLDSVAAQLALKVL